MATSEESLAFVAEWYDKLACIDKQFKFIYYPRDLSIEIIDCKSKK